MLATLVAYLVVGVSVGLVIVAGVKGWCMVFNFIGGDDD